MELILKILAEVLWKIGDQFNSRYPNRRCWLKTILAALLCAGISGYLIYYGWDTLLNGSTISKIVIGIFDAILVVSSFLIVIVGHKKRWRNI